MTGQPNATEEAITVGIDVAKHTIEVALGADGPILSLANDAAGFEALLEHLAAHRVALVVVEATGGLESALACTLQLAAYALAVITRPVAC